MTWLIEWKCIRVIHKLGNNIDMYSFKWKKSDFFYTNHIEIHRYI